MGISSVQVSKARAANGRWEKYARLRAVLVDSLRKIGKAKFTKLADMVEQCHEQFTAHRCRNGHEWAKTCFSCKLRLCPFEMRARSMAAIHKFGPVIKSMKEPKYLVLSMQNCQIDELKKGIKDLFAALKRLRHSQLWSGVRGALAVLEVTYNERERTWHPHLNVVFDGPYIPKPELNAAWLRSTKGRGCITWIERADGGTVCELLKYITKLEDFVHVPEAVEHFLTSTPDGHFIRTYGCLYGKKLKKELEQLEKELEQEGGEEEHEESSQVCPDCGTREIEKVYIFLRRDDVYFDGEGKLRFCWPEREALRSGDG